MVKPKMSQSSPRPEKHINSRGYPEVRHVSVPGYNKGTGTPKWLSSPARAAERRAK
jgi:hypothetical protein